MNILVIANCRLGDSLVMLPALNALRAHYGREMRLVLASEEAPHGQVAAEEILGGRGVVDEFVSLPMVGGKLARALARLAFFVRMRRTDWELGIVLMPPYPPLTLALVSRFRLYLRLCGARRIIAPDSVVTRPLPGQRFCPHVADAMLAMLTPLGIVIPPARKGDSALPPPLSVGVQPVLPELPEGKRFLAVAPGSNMAAKCWPHYDAVLKALCTSHDDLTPVYFGGENDRTLCEALHHAVPGICVIGQPLTVAEAVMRRCTAYLGNDTGLMHLASAVGLPCFAVFSCRDLSNIWEPYHSEGKVFRATGLPCEGCLRKDCGRVPVPCLEAVEPEEVTAALMRVLDCR